jgi:hypothetical protein
MAYGWSQWLTWLPLADAKGEAVAPRSIELKLDVPNVVTRSRRASSKQNKLAEPPESWRELNSHPVELLREVDRYLQRVNTERISASKRMEWVELALQYACPAIRKIYSEYYKSEALPEPHDRREGLVAAIKVCGQLATGYKHQLNQDFALPNARYVRVRERVRRSALRVLELIRMEQRLRAMRYQKLPAKIWRDCNRLFFAVSQCENMDTEYQALNCLQVSLDRKANDMERRAPTMVSMNVVYLSIQINGLLDSNTISSRKLHVVDAQVASVINSITIIPDHGKPLGRGKILIYHAQDCPAYFTRQDEKQRKKQQQQLRVRADHAVDEAPASEQLIAIIVDVAPLDVVLMAEHQKLLARFESLAVAEGSEGEQGTVTDQEDLANLLTIDAMCDGLHLKQRKEQREYAIGQKVLYVYNGFMSVYKLLVDMAAQDVEVPDELKERHDLRDALAGRSALIASDLEATESGQWFVVDQSAGGVHMKTRESQFTTALFIGQLVGFGFSREELKKPTLGYVVRLNRKLNKEIEVTIRILSHDAEATAVQSEFLSKNDMALPAIVLRSRVEKRAGAGHADGKVLQLILHHSHRLSPGTAIQIESGENKQAVEIADLVQLQREFVIYRLNYTGDSKTASVVEPT